jgi:hypothetical protein
MQESWDKILDKSFFFRIISNGQFETFLTLAGNIGYKTKLKEKIS